MDKVKFEIAGYEFEVAPLDIRAQGTLKFALEMERKGNEVEQRPIATLYEFVRYVLEHLTNLPPEAVEAVLDEMSIADAYAIVDAVKPDLQQRPFGPSETKSS